MDNFKTIYLIFVLLFSILSNHTFSQSKFNFSIESGSTLFNGDVKNTYTLSTYNLHRPSFALTAEYNPWSFAGLGLKYSSLYIRADNGTFNFITIANNYTPYLSVYPLSFFNATKDWKFCFSLNAGAGLSFYGDNYWTFYYPLDVIMYLRITNNLSVYMTNEYAFFNKDFIECSPIYNFRGTTNDRVFNSSFGLRYSFGQ